MSARSAGGTAAAERAESRAIGIYHQRNERAFSVPTHIRLRPHRRSAQAIEALVKGLEDGRRHLTLLGATGTGKTFTMANVIARLGKPTLIISHNKTLAAQLYEEMRELFPKNAVAYFVSYYDYYQPRRTSRSATSISRKTPPGTTTSTACA